jgi:ubiquinone biosynthesis protein
VPGLDIRVEHTARRPLAIWFACLERCLVLGSLTLVHSARFAFRRMRCLVWGGPSPAQLWGNFLARLFEALGPSYIKVGQILSSRPDLLPQETVDELGRLQDRVAPFDVGLIPGIFKSAFGRPIGDIFQTFDMAPISSASVAHVHRARLHDGTEVAVKIRRPGIVDKVHDDFRILRGFGRILELLPPLRNVPITSVINEFGEAIVQQLDFTLEAENNRCFQKNFRDAGHVRIPALFDSYCTDSILTMAYIPDLRKLSDIDLSPAERQQTATVGLQALYQMIFVDGLVHADMHQANVFFGPGSTFTMLDLGLVAKLETRVRKDFLDFFYAMATNDGLVCARIIYDGASYRSPRHERAAFERHIVELVNRYSSLSAHQFEVSGFVVGIFEAQRRFGIRGSTAFMMTILSLLVFEGILKQVYPEMDFQLEAKKMLPRARALLYPRSPWPVFFD